VARIVIKRDGEGYSTEVIWERDEWCKRVPRFWLDWCGCRRCCDAVAILPRLREDERRELLDAGVLLIGYTRANSRIYPWFLRYYPNRREICLAPWPKRLYATLL